MLNLNSSPAFFTLNSFSLSLSFLNNKVQNCNLFCEWKIFEIVHPSLFVLFCFFWSDFYSLNTSLTKKLELITLLDNEMKPNIVSSTTKINSLPSVVVVVVVVGVICCLSNSRVSSSPIPVDTSCEFSNVNFPNRTKAFNLSSVNNLCLILDFHSEISIVYLRNKFVFFFAHFCGRQVGGRMVRIGANSFHLQRQHVAKQLGQIRIQPFW